MNYIQVTSSQDVNKSPPTLDKIPEDVQVAIIKFIQSWKRSEGTEQEREKGKRARDSALRAVALSCRNLFSIYQRELLFDVTLDFRSSFRFYLLLARNRDARKLVTSITFTRQDVDFTQEELDELGKDLREDLDEISKALRAQGIEIDEGKMKIKWVLEGVYRFLSHIQTLVIRTPEANIPLQSNWANARLPPLAFLTHSLKKLFIPTWESMEHNFRARNVVWVLVFCTGLRFATLCCIFDQNDFKYLTEFSSAFSGLAQVRKLALGVHFSATQPIETYWSTAVGEQWLGGNKKSQAIFYLLKVTRNLQCLEIDSMPSVQEEEETVVNFSCLSALRSSYHSLESIRLFGLGINQVDPEEAKANTNFALFKKLKAMSLDVVLLLILARIPVIKFPPGLKLLRVPYYNTKSTAHEDLELAHAFGVRSFPSLEEVIVPSGPTLRNGTVSDSDGYKRRWLQGRRELEKAEIFRSGKVKLRIVEPGEFIGESSETDFMSTLSWISPP